MRGKKINSYVAVLLITLFGAGASLLIIRVSQTTSFGYYTGSGIATTTTSQNK